jgi:amino acid transporter
MEGASIASPGAGAGVGDKGLKSGALGSVSNLVIAVASTAPAYSLAATLGFIAAIDGVGLFSPAILLVSFVPMLCISFAYRYMNRADPDCGTSFTWVTRALGPQLGWLTGWAIVVADVVVMANLAQIAASYTFLLFGADHAATQTVPVLVVGVAWIAVMTFICYWGIELSARTQVILLGAEVLVLAIFAAVALIDVYANSPAGSIKPALSWIEPWKIGSFSALTTGVLLGAFIYWGWDSGVAVNEESRDASRGPGKMAVLSTVLLLLIYIVVSYASQAHGGVGVLTNENNQDDVLSVLGKRVFGTPWDKLLIVAVLSSAAASTQTTILPTARTTLSMARNHAVPGSLGRVHPRHLTPSVSTLLMGAVSAAWFALLEILSPTNLLGDSIAALGFLIAFYYGLTGFACAIYYRRELLKSAKNLIFAGIVPVLGGVMLALVFVSAIGYYGDPANSYSGKFLGVAVPLLIGIGSLVLGVLVMGISYVPFRSFFRRRPETAPAGLLEER